MSSASQSSVIKRPHSPSCSTQKEERFLPLFFPEPFKRPSRSLSTKCSSSSAPRSPRSTSSARRLLPMLDRTLRRCAALREDFRNMIHPTNSVGNTSGNPWSRSSHMSFSMSGSSSELSEGSLPRLKPLPFPFPLRSPRVGLSPSSAPRVSAAPEAFGDAFGETLGEGPGSATVGALSKLGCSGSDAKLGSASGAVTGAV